MKTIPYGHQFIQSDDIKEVIAVLKSDWITQGPKIREFEAALCKYAGARYAVAVSSGTAALHIACLAAGINKGDEVATSSLTFIASANCILYCGGKSIFVDIHRDTANIDADKIENNISKKTKVIIPVHFAGHPCDLAKIKRIAQKYNLLVIEDGAHALGAKYQSEKIGSCRYSDMTIFSFHPVKSITTGEGGAVLTNNKEIYNKLLAFRTHGITNKNFLFNPDGEWYYEMQYLGYNYRITDFQAALGISQLHKLNRFIEKRRQIAKIYHKVFIGNPYFDIPPEEDYAYSSFHLYPIRLKDKFKDKKKEVFSELRRRGLWVQVHYMPVYLHPYYKRLGYKKGLCPVAEDFYAREISIPLYPTLKQKEIKYVITTLLTLLKKHE